MLLATSRIVKKSAKREKSMRAIIIYMVLLVLSSCTLVSGGNFSGEPEPVSMEMIKPARWRLPNGLEVVFSPDPEVPTVRGVMLFRGGSLWEPEDRVGSTVAMGSQMRRGGAGRHSADQLDTKLEKLAASVSSSFGSEVGEVSFNCLRSDLDQVFGIFSEVILKPRFEQKQLTVYKDRLIEKIRRRVDSPDSIASTSYWQILFGGTRYGRPLLTSDVNKFDRVTLLRAHREFVRPELATLVVTGDLSRKTIEKYASKYFKNWKGE